MKTFIVSLLLLLCISQTKAQQKNNTLTVFVQAIKNDAVNNASIQLFSLPDSILVSSQVSNKKGNVFTVTLSSTYIIKVSSIGFETQQKTATITDKPLSISFLLQQSTASLQTVVVTGKKPLIKQEDDKTVVDATVLANSSTNAY